MKKKFIIISSIIICFIGISCRHSVDFSQYPDVKYSTDVNPIIIANCTQRGCHGGADSKRFKLLTYDDVVKHCGIVNGHPEKSNLYTIIRSYSNYNRMPAASYAQLTDDQIKVIYLWIGQGAKNN